MIRKISLIALLLWNNIMLAEVQKLVYQEVHGVSTEDYASFKDVAGPLIAPMLSKRIVGLGEGTHGTSEFYQVRAWISRLLIEEGGFNCIAFENDFSDGILFDKGLSEGKNIDSLMRKHFLSIWQNKELREFMGWLRQYNETHEKKVLIRGLDYVMLRPDLDLIQRLLKPVQDVTTKKLLSDLKKAANFQDSIWEGMNMRAFRYNRDSLLQNGYKGYQLAEQLEKRVETIPVDEQNGINVSLAILNIKQAFAPFYHVVTKTKEKSRDENMALTAAKLLKDTSVKMIIWAHNGHVAKKAVFNGGTGGMGGYLAHQFPGDYFVLGTGTAFGTFGATTDARDTYRNKMKAYPLEKPIKNSWESVFSGFGDASFYVLPDCFNSSGIRRPLRFIGYNPNSGKDSYVETDIREFFDAFLFIRNTHAAQPIADK